MFLGVSLWTYDRFDPPSTLVDPPSNPFTTPAVGRRVYGELLFESTGYGAYYVLASLVVLTVMLLAHREIDQPMVRAVGWMVSLAGLMTFAALVVPNWTPGP